ncbi:hypothetical protein BpHYR1_017338 [Brachionus plicatilis]|uniref:Uncharacterized protein n=1 Tax=Brachionus plicatilis TaxID=10195 RepID=A0A3M7QN29_BRAPC|nr:hypothetical protein BpHYR1_017338 [Brachionus plicatilis]
MACMNRLMELCGSVSMSARRALVSSCRIAATVSRNSLKKGFENFRYDTLALKKFKIILKLIVCFIYYF